jgi:hypothetical protein
MVEALEQRQLMFALSSTPFAFNPFGGVPGAAGGGQAAASISFDYFTPFITRAIQGMMQPTVTQNFDADFSTFAGQTVQQNGQLPPGNNSVAPAQLVSPFSFRTIGGGGAGQDGAFLELQHNNFAAAPVSLTPTFVTGQSTTGGNQLFSGLSDVQNINLRLPTNGVTSAGLGRNAGLSSIRQFQFTAPNFVATENFNMIDQDFATLPINSGSIIPMSNLRVNYSDPAAAASVVDALGLNQQSRELAARINGANTLSLFFTQFTDPNTVAPNDPLNSAFTIDRLMQRFRFRTPGFSSAEDFGQVDLGGGTSRAVNPAGEVLESQLAVVPLTGATASFVNPMNMNSNSGNELRGVLTGGAQLALRWPTLDDPAAVARQMDVFRFRVTTVDAGNNPVVPAGLGVQLLSRGTVVRTYTTAQLTAAQDAGGFINLQGLAGAQFDDVRFVRAAGAPATVNLAVDEMSASGRGRLDPTTSVTLSRAGVDVATFTAAQLQALPSTVATPIVRNNATPPMEDPGTEYRIDFAEGFDEVRFSYNAAGGLAGSAVIIDEIKAQGSGTLDTGTDVVLRYQGRVVDTIAADTINGQLLGIVPNNGQLNVQPGQQGVFVLLAAEETDFEQGDENFNSVVYVVSRTDDPNTPTSESLSAVFDEVIFQRNAGGFDNGGLIFDDLVVTQPGGSFRSFLEPGLRGAQVAFTGLTNNLFGNAPDPATVNNAFPTGATAQELFDDGPGVPLGEIAVGGTLFNQNTNRLRASSLNYAAGTRPTIAAGANSNEFVAGLSNDQEFSFSFLDRRGNARPMTSFTFTTPTGVGGAGLDDGTQITLLRDGRVVRVLNTRDLANPAIRTVNPLDPNSDVYVIDTVTNGSVADPTASFGYADNAGNRFQEGFSERILNFGAAFDTVVFSREGQAGDDVGGIQIDRVSGYSPTMAEFFDLYGRPMRPTVRGGAPEGVLPYLLSDANDDGVPDYNDGIGRIVISNTDTPNSLVGLIAPVPFTAANFTMYGGVAEEYDEPTDSFVITSIDSTLGNYDELEDDAHFAYRRSVVNGQEIFDGLPLGTGSVVVGSPYIRDNRDPILYHGVNPAATIGQQTNPIPASFPTLRGGALGGFAPRSGSAAGFDFVNENLQPAGPNLIQFPGNNWSGTLIENRLDDPANALVGLGGGVFGVPTAVPQPTQFQGIFTADGQSVGDITVHGILHGSSSINGAARRFAVGFLPGSVNIAGDVGTFSVASDAGAVFFDPLGGTPPDDGPGPNRPLVPTGSRITIRGAVRQMYIGARNLSTVSVDNDTNNPNVAKLDFSRYTEAETIYGIDPSNPNIELAYNDSTFLSILPPAAGGRNAPSAIPYGNVGYRNDYAFDPLAGLLLGPTGEPTASFAGAEYIGSTLRSVIVTGSVGARDAVSDFDRTDLYAFVGDQGNRVSINAQFFPPPASQAAALTRVQVRVFDSAGRVVANHQFPFVSDARTPQAGVTVRLGFTPQCTDTYYMMIFADDQDNVPSGASLSYQVTVTGMGQTALGYYKSGAGTQGFLTVDGRIGILGLGRGFVSEAPDFISPANLTTPTVEDDATFRGGKPLVLNVGGIVTTVANGLGGAVFNVAGDAGTFRVAQDLAGATFNIGGTFGGLVVGGAIAGDSISDAAPAPAAAVVINTGLNGGPGDIGQIVAGAFINGRDFTVNTSSGSTIVLIRTPRIALAQPTLNLGAGSDVRFVDVGQVAIGSIVGSPDNNGFQNIPYGTRFRVTDDSGAIYTIFIEGGAGPGVQQSSAQILLLPVANSLGVAVAQLNVTLIAGANLRIEGSTGGKVSIGRLNIAGGDGRRSVITFGGRAEVDVLNVSGGALNTIQNTTAGGDIVNIDVVSLNNLVITGGNLGRIDLPAVVDCSDFLALELGVAPINTQGGQLPGVGGPLALQLGSLDGLATQGQPVLLAPYIPTDQDPVSIQELGSPVDGRLQGMVVRTGGVQQIRVAGKLGDVYVPGGLIGNVQVNSDNRTAPGGFDGIVGRVYAAAINFIDVGDGLSAPGDDSFADAGIFADGPIATISGGTRYRGVTISGLIISATSIGTVTLKNGRYDNAYIAAATLDSFWRSARFAATTQINEREEQAPARGAIGFVRGEGTDMFRTTVFANTITGVLLTNGAFDASQVDGRGVGLSVGTVSAREFRNSTRDGDPLEYRFTSVRSSSSIGTISAVNDIADLFVDAQANVNLISATNIVRADLQIDGTTQRLAPRNDLRSSRLTTGRLVSAAVPGDIRSSSFLVAGRIETLTAGGAATNTEVLSSGPDGRINTLRVGTDFSGTITTDGPIGTINAGRDLRGSIRTTDRNNGAINMIRAGRDLTASIDAAGNLVSVMAGGSIGQRPTGPGSSRSFLNVVGTVGTLTAGGQIYSFVRIGAGLTGSISVGRVSALPAADLVSDATIDVNGRIPSVRITGDFGGSIISRSGGIGSVSITNGSFRRGADPANPNRIEARDGDIGTVTVSNGSLFGDVVSRDGSIGSVAVTGAGFGDIGVNPDRSNATSAGDGFRNQLPPGVAPTAGRDGPTIRAARDIGTVSASGGIFESVVIAGRNLTSVTAGANGIRNDAPTGNAFVSVIGAGDSVGGVTSRGPVVGLHVIGGLVSLGDDNAAGGVAGNADTLKNGRVGNLAFNGGTTNVRISAGLSAGVDGVYNTEDDLSLPGLSSVGNVTVTGAAATATSAFADTVLGTTSAGVVRGGAGLAPADARVYTGPFAGAGISEITIGQPFVATVGADSAVVRVTGPANARAIYDAPNRRIVLSSTDGLPVVIASLIIEANPAAPATQLTNLQVVTTDDVSVTTLTSRLPLRGTSSVYVDGNIGTLSLANTTTSGFVAAGGDIATAVIGTAGANAPANALRLEAQAIGSATFNGDFGQTTASRLDALSLGSLTVNGSQRAVVSVTRDVGAVRLTGALANGRIRAGGSIASLTAASTNFGRVSAGGNIGPINIAGDAVDTPFLAGIDLGNDANFGGTGAAADTVSAGSVGNVTVGGGFIRSDVSAGISRGADGFLNTGDDLISEGVSTVGVVRIRGTQVGSTVLAQRYAVISTGGNGAVTVANVPVGATNFGNFGNVVQTTRATPLVVTDLRLQQEGPTNYRAVLAFNQSLVGSTLAPALTISEVRIVNGAETIIPLVQGTDYTVRYDAAARAGIIVFSSAVTSRTLAGDVPLDTESGPGVFRFELDAAVIRGQTVNAGLDGNNDGVVTGNADDYTVDALVGDAGDRLFSGTTTDPQGVIPVTFRGPTSLDLLMDDNRSSNDRIADANRLFTLRGIAGDHPNRNSTFFDGGSDVDVYSVTLRAGQILRLGGITGAASALGRAIIGPNDAGLVDNQGNAPTSFQLQLLQNTSPNATTSDYLVTVGGVYNIVLLPNVADLLEFNPFGAFAAADPSVSTNAQPGGGTSGDYAFTIEIFDDGDSGFFGQNVPTVAAPANLVTFDDFAGPDAAFGTPDDLKVAEIADADNANPPFFFQIYLGADGQLGTADDEFRGENGLGFFARQTAGPDDALGTGDDVLTLVTNNLPGPAPVDPDGVGPLQAVPVPQEFAGVDGILGNADDLATVTRVSTNGPSFTYRLLNGPTGAASADSIVRGTNGLGVVSSRSSGADGVFGNGDDLVRNTSDAGNGLTLQSNAVRPSDFAGVDNTLGTADDVATIVRDDFIYTLSRGANNRFDGNGTAPAKSDDVVVATRTASDRSAGVASTYSAGTDGIFGTADDRTTSLVDGSIGTPAAAGLPIQAQGDVDVFHLNGGATITPGTRIRVTLKTGEVGGNLGLVQPVVDVFGNVTSFRIVDNRGTVQFGIFDTTTATNINDALLVAAPSRASAAAPTGGQLTTSALASYGYDSSGDLFIEFAAPRRQDDPARAGTFAAYIQGLIRTDYQLEVTTTGVVTTLPAATLTQNILINTAGGTINFFEANPFSPTVLKGFDASSIGFQGTIGGVGGIGGQPVDEYIIENTVARLQAIFDLAFGNDPGTPVIRVSSNAADFEGQDYSTVFVSSTDVPASFFGNGTFGASQRIDLFNANANDQAVVFVNELSAVGAAPDQSGADALVISLSAAIGRRVGELVGLRLTASDAVDLTGDLLASDSVTLNLIDGAFIDQPRLLSGQGDAITDTDFFLGTQNGLQLLRRIFFNPA